MATFETNLVDTVNLLEKAVLGSFKDALKARLLAHAHVIIEDVATQMAKDILVKMDAMHSVHDGNFTLRLRIFEEEKNFVIEKTVKEVPKRKN